MLNKDQNDLGGRNVGDNCMHDNQQVCQIGYLFDKQW